MLSEAYGEETMKKSCAFEWHKRFEEATRNEEYVHHFIPYHFEFIPQI